MKVSLLIFPTFIFSTYIFTFRGTTYEKNDVQLLFLIE